MTLTDSYVNMHNFVTIFYFKVGIKWRLWCSFLPNCRPISS